MSKIIKKQIKRSMPWFLILCLFSSLVMGAAFNYNIEFKDLRNFNLTSPEASADDTATTTVKVKNAAPNFSGSPYEVVSSTSTTPVNAGASISFSGTGSDPELANYYLLICSTNSATATPSAAPTCVGGTQFCVSGSTANLTEATCNYNNVATVLPESQSWYAFVCDSHPTDPACNSAGSQGSGPNINASSSPFYVNHGPHFTIATTTIDYLAPGGTHTISASSTDLDIVRGGDQVTMTVCSTNSYSTTTGCGVATYCTSTPAASDPSCTYTTPVPLLDQAYQYWVFMKDNFNLVATSGPITSYYHVTNVAPVIGNITINNGADVVLNIKGAADKIVVATSTVTDNNTCGDLSGTATGTMYISNAVGANLCAPDDSSCYQVTSANCGINVGSCVGATAVVTCTSSLKFFAKPTNAIADNPNALENWLFAIRAYDEALNGVATSSTGVEVMNSTALDVTETLLDYGPVRSSFDTADLNATSTIVNYGNTPLDPQVQVDDMASTSGSQKIYCENQKYASSTFTYSGGGFPGSSTTPAYSGLNIARPTSATNVTAPLYWGIGIPYYVPSGDYYGTNTFIAATKLSGGTW